MEKKVSAIVALSSFILYFEFCVQILVPPSGLKDGSNNICPLRNQFQLLFVTNRRWKFGVGRKGGYRETPIKEGTFSVFLVLRSLFFDPLSVFLVLCFCSIFLVLCSSFFVTGSVFLVLCYLMRVISSDVFFFILYLFLSHSFILIF